MLLKTSPNKIKKAGDNATATVPLTERTRLLELNAPKLHTDRGTNTKTWTKQPIMPSTVL